MAVAEHKVIVALDRSELDEALRDLEELGERVQALQEKFNDLTLRVSLDMTGSVD
jgi:predicted translin family RNA/ssDNA-binding protein